MVQLHATNVNWGDVLAYPCILWFYFLPVTWDDSTSSSVSLLMKRLGSKELLVLAFGSIVGSKNRHYIETEKGSSLSFVFDEFLEAKRMILGQSLEGERPGWLVRIE
jgi:hypothetical protein